MDKRSEPDRDNGGNDPHPRCSWNERRIDHNAQLATETRQALIAVSSTVDSMRAWSVDFEARALREFDRLSSAVSTNDAKLDRLLEGLAIGAVRPAQPSLDWDINEPTLHGREPEQAAIVWKHRATHEAEKSEALNAKVAALEATLEEQRRNSTRVRDDRKDRAKLIVAVIVALLTSSGGTLLLAKLLGE